MPTPNKDRLRLWVADLRSGRFTQTGRTLKDEVGYCCLGVACETYAREAGKATRWVLRQDEDTDEMSLHFVVGHEASAAVLPETVAEWFGIPINPLLNSASAGKEMPCGYLNDDAGLSFAEIADAAEATFGLASP